MKNPFRRKQLSDLDRLGIKKIKRKIREICIVRKSNTSCVEEWVYADHYIPIEDLLKDEDVIFVKERSRIETKYRRKTREELLNELQRKTYEK